MTGQASKLWQPPISSIILGALAAVAVASLFRGIGASLLWAMGSVRFGEEFFVPLLYRISKVTWVWMIAGGSYGWLHRRHLRADAGLVNHRLRQLFFIITLAVEGFAFGHFVLVPAYAWYSDLPPLAWLRFLGLPLSVIGMFIGASAGKSVYISKDSLFTLILIEAVSFGVFGVVGIVNAVFLGYLCGIVGWVVGFLLNLPLHFFVHLDPSSVGFRWGCAVGGITGFAYGLNLVLKKGNR